MNRRNRWIAGLAACAVVVMGMAACGGDDDDDGADTTPAATPAATSAGGNTPATGGAVVEVTLNEFAVVPDPDTIAAGEITFRATNDGPEDAHEMVIIRTDLAPDALPTVADGSVPEEEIDLVDEIEEIAVGESDEVTVELAAGSYVLICNIVQTEADGSIESHYQKGMRSAFTVE